MTTRYHDNMLPFEHMIYCTLLIIHYLPPGPGIIIIASVYTWQRTLLSRVLCSWLLSTTNTTDGIHDSTPSFHMRRLPSLHHHFFAIRLIVVTIRSTLPTDLLIMFSKREWSPFSSYVRTRITLLLRI